MNIKCKLGIHEYKCVKSVISRKEDDNFFADKVKMYLECKKCGYTMTETQRFIPLTTISN